MITNFKEWIQLRELYGIESPEIETAQYELRGIRESIKNMLASHNVFSDWSINGNRVRNLAKFFPEKKEEIERLHQLYQTMIYPIGEVAHKFQGMSNHPQLRDATAQAVKKAYGYFKLFVNQLYELSGRNSMGRFMKKM